MEQNQFNDNFIRSLTDAESERFLEKYEINEAPSRKAIKKHIKSDMKRAAWLLTCPLDDAEEFITDISVQCGKTDDIRIGLKALELFWNSIVLMRTHINKGTV